ncbi:hypothetical protein [Gymnodinialimonas ulvae]|uniref:hypothetical protein n=1 Tax=Gymnodinialimonas ulvae TaxID=3126504 RepID=UPI00309F044E
MNADRKAWGWCPSVLRPMPLDDGLMVRIRVPGGALTRTQAQGLADLAESFGAGFIELTNRANLQLRGLSTADHAALVPELDALGLTEIDHTPSGRVNITQSPFLDQRASLLATDLAEKLAEKTFGTLPQKFGFVVDVGPKRVLSDVPGDVRIEAAGDAVIVRADGVETGGVVADPVARCVEIARWFIASGCIGADGRGRLVDHAARLPEDLCGETRPNAPETISTDGPAWVVAQEGRLRPATLRMALKPGVTALRVTPFRALYLPELALAQTRDNKAETTTEGDGVDAV